MPLTELLVATDVRATSVVAWTAVIGAPTEFDVDTAAQIEIGGQVIDIAPESWRQWIPKSGQRAVWYARTSVSTLTPNTAYELTLILDGQESASATMTTLPDALPPVSDRPFTVLLGSCFGRRHDKGLAQTLAVLQQAGAWPDIKILCGDQVYMDTPTTQFVLPQTEKTLGDSFFDNYTLTWMHPGGFERLLTQGANFLASDDHDFWNNAPFRAFHLPNTWTEGGRLTWRRMADALFEAFQTDMVSIPGSIRAAFSVPPVAFLVADTRVNRQTDRKAGGFMRPQDLNEIVDWIAGLTGPGVIVLGQPIFAKKTPFFQGVFVDWNLTDYKQYEDLCRAILSTPQPLVVLCGDMHFGRVAIATAVDKPPVIEIISSPLALAEGPISRRAWQPAPDRFPTNPLPGVAQRTVETIGWGRSEEHFLTLEFWAQGEGARLRVRLWEIAVPDTGKEVFAYDLKRSS